MNKKGKILIIDMAGTIEEAIAPVLGSARLAYISVPNLAKAVEYLHSSTPGLVFIDYDVPAKDAVVKASQLIKRIPRCKNVEIHFLTSYRDGIEDVVSTASADGHILKPLSETVFSKWLRQNPDVVESVEKIVVAAPAKAPVPPAPVVVKAPVPPAPVVVKAPVPPAPVAVKASVPPAPAASDVAQPVLLIGQCTSLQELHEANTEPLGIEFIFCATMAEGAQSLKDKIPKAIVIDFDLSDVPGGQACSILKQIPDCANIPVTMIGDDVENIVQGQLEAIGASGYLKKPFTTMEFLSYLARKSFVSFPEEIMVSLGGQKMAQNVDAAPVTVSSSHSASGSSSPGVSPVPDSSFLDISGLSDTLSDPGILQQEVSAAPSSSAPLVSPAFFPGTGAFDDLPDMDMELDMELPIVTLEPTMADPFLSSSVGDPFSVSSQTTNFDHHLRTGTIEDRIEICLSLGEQKNTSGVPALINLLEEGIEDMLTEVCWSLGEIGDPRAVPALVNLMNGKKLLYQSKAIEALGKIGDESAVIPIVQVMSDITFELKIPIIRAFEKIGGANSKKALGYLADDPNYNVSKLAREVLEKM